jgi:hypothetical protein
MDTINDEKEEKKNTRRVVSPCCVSAGVGQDVCQAFLHLHH